MADRFTATDLSRDYNPSLLKQVFQRVQRALAGQLTDLTAALALKYDKAGGTITGAIAVQGTVIAAPNATVVANNAGQAQLWALGPDTSTPGTMALVTGRSDLSSSTTVATLTQNDVTLAVPLKLANTVNAVSPTSPNRTVTIVIGGTTYYLHAKTTND